MQSFAIIGTGAVGGYYGALLQRGGFNVHFLLHSDYAFVKENGLMVESVNGDFRLPQVNAYRDAKQMPPCDVVIVALKATANSILKDVLPCVLKEDGVVLTLQNGLGSEEEMAAIVGSERVLGGLCFLCSSNVGPGHIRQSDYGLIMIGEYRKDGRPAGISPRLEQVAGDLESAGISVRMVDDLLLARWKKLVWNIPFNGMSVACNALTDELMKNPETRSLCSAMMKEVAAASAACARPIEDEFVEKMLMDTETMTPYAPSMRLDYDRGHPMEIESIYGNPLRAARAAGVEMPETEKLYHRLIEIDRALRAR